MREIDCEKLRISKYNVRKELGNIDELAASITQVGILEPLIVKSSAPNIFEIIIGQRRFFAARKAGLKKVPCIVKEMSAEEAILASLIENVQRGDITEEEVVRAFLTLRERSKTNWTQKKFSKRIGKSQSWLSGILTAYQTLIKLKTLGIVKGMKSYPSKEDKEKGVVQVEHLKEIEYALRSKNVRNTLSEREIENKRVELAQAILDLPIEKAKQVISNFKIKPEKPVTQIKVETFGGSTKRREPPRINTKASEQFTRAQSMSDPFVNDFKKYLLTLEDEAKHSLTKIPVYVKEVIPRFDPELYRKIGLLTDDLDQLVLDAVSQKIPYFESLKTAIVKEEKIPEFKEYIHDTLENWLQKTITLKNCSRAEPGIATGKSYCCGLPLEYIKDDFHLICPNCKKTQEFKCPICEGGLTFKPPTTLVCETCTYRLKFRRKIHPEITLEYACYCALNNIKDPRLRGKRLVIFKKQPDNTKKILKVAASW
jgi:ParB/RepB/Spo0J family partition protein